MVWYTCSSARLKSGERAESSFDVSAVISGQHPSRGPTSSDFEEIPPREFPRSNFSFSESGPAVFGKRFESRELSYAEHFDSAPRVYFCSVNPSMRMETSVLISLALFFRLTLAAPPGS